MKKEPTKQQEKQPEVLDSSIQVMQSSKAKATEKPVESFEPKAEESKNTVAPESQKPVAEKPASKPEPEKSKPEKASAPVPVEKKHRKKVSASELVSALLFIVGVCSLALSSYMAFIWFQPATYTQTVAQKLSALEEESDVVDVPDLQLNRVYRREGPQVVVDPNNSGKENPFQ